MKSITRLAILAILLTATSADAHAFLDHADPKVGSIIHEAPSHLTLWITENLEPAFSKLQVFDARGTEVDSKDVKVIATL